MPKSKSSRSKRTGSRRQKRGKSYYTRKKNGQFEAFTSIKRSLKADRRKKSGKKVKPGFGHLGDR